MVSRWCSCGANGSLKGRGKIVFRKPNFTANADSFILLCQKVDIGQILELDSSEVAQISPHLQGHPETIYIACSGVCLTGQQGCFLSGAQQIAV
jgi:hypothetical protein